jgi:hypothetical protein
MKTGKWEVIVANKRKKNAPAGSKEDLRTITCSFTPQTIDMKPNL